MPANKNKPTTPIETTVHKDRRTNIPTEELRGFVADDENKPKTILYPRDQSLDPQLVWKGKDEQDAQDLAVPAVPIYIQEKIHPKYLIEELRAQSNKDKPESQFNFFADFNGIDFEQMVEFYRHDQNWSNRMILGDSLLVMTSLAEKEGLKGKVQMIYIDPPYGISFGSNWQASTRKRDVKDGSKEDTTRQPEQIKAFRDTWKLGIHSYLAYLRDRLAVARDLLTETGSVFVQIGDENVHLVRCVLDEIFGSENFVSLITFKKTNPLGASGLGAVSDYLLWYAKKHEQIKFRRLLLPKKLGTDGVTGYAWVESPIGDRRRLTAQEMQNIADLPTDLRLFAPTKLTAAGLTPSCVYPFEYEGKTFYPKPGNSWRTNAEGMKAVVATKRLIALGDSIYQVMYFDDYPVTELTNLWTDTRGEMGMTYVVQTATNVIERCLLMTTDPGDLVLDPTCGSGTTAFVAEEWGRRWITIDTSRVALALARTRLMSAKYPYYLLADSSEGVKKEAELTGRMPPAYKTEGDVRKGFVYKHVPHVTLKSIANNPDIKEGMTRKEIDEAIARHAETETIYDQPFEDKKRVRVTGPFTVESLSPHRFIALEEERPATEKTAQQGSDSVQFETMILDNLRKAGVQNTIKNEKIKFDRLESYAGQYVHATGEYTDKDGKTRRVAVSIGPQYGTVGPDTVKEAAKEAVQGIGYDVLIVCGFAFDPHVSEEAKRYGKLIVLITHINPELFMGDELLKSTGAGNLFMVFGEPDVVINKQKDGKFTVEIKGLDIYDPTTGQVRSNSTQDIACWFIDTDYNGESFFVRHAYFTDGVDKFERLKRTLRAEIDESAWDSLYATVSRPFTPPKTGKIAIKVINHYGDEVLKVYEVR
ncbi:MAG: site-specific DNA-methyltransferase [Dehalococcoidales bacterium]|nr:site-specific DNA-methyltransferase [Dehalococcoidales bacterium]